MSYRGPNPQRMVAQAGAAQFQYAGQTATWRKFVSASSGNAAVGLGSSYYYAQRLITALFFGVPGQGFNLPERQTMAGLLTEGSFVVATREALGAQDELLWRGKTYRIEGEPVPMRVGGNNAYIIKRGK